MTKLGKIWTDDPAYSTGTIEPNTQGADIGSITNPYQDGYFSGSVSSAATVAASIEYTDNPFLIYADTNDGFDSKAMTVSGGGADSVARGGYSGWYGNEHGSFPGYSTTFSGVIANSKIVEQLGVASALIEWRNATGGAMWTMNNSGDLIQNGTNGGNIVFSEASGNILSDATTKIVNIGGGTSISDAAGAYISLFGNTHAGQPGDLDLNSGNVANADIIYRVNNGTGSHKFVVAGTEQFYGTAAGIVFQQAQSSIQLQSGANGRTGTFTLNGATPVVVGNTSLAAQDMIIITRDTEAGTPAPFNMTARVNGTSFSVTGTAGDTSPMRYALIRVN